MIRRRSPKRAKQEREYKKLRDKWIEGKECERCGGEATEVHHAKGRLGALLTDTEHFVALCRACHSWVESHPAESKRLGYSKSRLNIEQ